MPCGGIYPTIFPKDDECFSCGEPINDDLMALAVVEWDAAIHMGCLRAFSGTFECAVIREHQHPIITEVNETGEYVRLLCFSPELGASDWARCQIDANGDEVVVESWSREEYRSDQRR